MTPKTRYGFWIEADQLEGLRHIKARDGVLESEQIRRAIDMWLRSKGVQGKSDRQRASTRKRP